MKRADYDGVSPTDEEPFHRLRTLYKVELSEPGIYPRNRHLRHRWKGRGYVG